VFRNGKKINFPSIYVYILVKENGPTRLGLVVSRKVGGAFLRNKYKRIIREFFRLNYHSFPPGTDIVIGVKPGTSSQKVAQIRSQLNDFIR
jgi:ribonuclease P protein component